MPLRINLLAEAIEVEEARRKDPVKRAGIAAGILVFFMLTWAGMLQSKIILSNSELKRLDASWKSIETKYDASVNSHRRATEIEDKLTQLGRLSTNRFLWGTVLDSVQQAIKSVDDIQVLRLKTEQSYLQTEGIRAQTNEGVVIPGKPGTSIERLTLTIEAIDASPQPGGRVSAFKDALTKVEFLKGELAKTNGILLTSLSAPQRGATTPNTFVTFTLQCNFSEKVR